MSRFVSNHLGYKLVVLLYTVSQIKTVNFLSQLCQIFTSFNNFWLVDG